MRRFVFSLCFIAAGSAMWWGLSNTARFSVKKWDAKFDSVLRHRLTDMGVSNGSLVSAVNELKSDAGGDYVVRRMSLKNIGQDTREALVRALQSSGAYVQTIKKNGNTVLHVKRGNRLYQELTFIP